MRPLESGGHVPHFIVPNLAGGTGAYGDIWQKRPMVLVRLVDGSTAAALVERLSILGADTAVVVTTAELPGVPAAAAVVADRWGEIAFVAHAPRDQDLPSVSDIVDWVRHVEMKCPECEGEAR